MNNYLKIIEQKLECPSSDEIEFIQNEILLCLSVIENASSLEDAKLTFNILEEIQFLLAKAVFKNGIKVTPMLMRFISDFERIDDDDVKVYLYDKIKSKEYLQQ